MSARRTCQYPARAPFKRPLVAWGGGMLCVLLLASGCSQSSQQTSETKRNPEEVLRMLEAPTEESVATRLARRMIEKRAQLEPTPLPESPLTMGQALETQQEMVNLLIPTAGPVAGYKAGLTNPATQKVLGISQPIHGVFLQKMLHPEGEMLSYKFGSRPVVEADLLVRVKDEGIHEAKTNLEVLEHLDLIIPFLELADLTYAETDHASAADIVAANAGASMGVMGNGVTPEATQEWVNRLGHVAVVVTDNTGEEVTSGNTSNLMGHPLNAVRWLAADLRASGIQLKAGDLLSLGSIGTPIPARAGLRLRAVYHNLSPDTHTSVGVQFAE
ncbi:MAG: hydratase [Nitrospirota bacterium]|nr:hydratase [Nitrospirota bacterium]